MKKILLLLPVLAMLAACQRETPVGSNRTVDIRISTGESRLTRADLTDVSIKDVDVLVFDNTDTPNIHSDAKFLYARYAWHKSGDIYNTTLKFGSNLDIYFAINARDIISAANIAVGDTWSAVHDALMLENPNLINRAANGLPMWGYRYGVTLAESVGNNFGIVKVLRAVASADIEIATENQFTLAAGHIVFGSNQGFLAFTPDAANMDFGSATGVDMNNPQVDFEMIEPEVPAGTTTTVDWRYAVPAASATPDEIMHQFYFYENEGPNVPYTNGKRYTKVVIEGKWHDPSKLSPDSYVTSYYPISFRDQTITDGSNNILPVIRNNKFIIRITAVNGNGFPTLDEAKNGEDRNITYQIIPWDEWLDTDIYMDGTRFISIEASRNDNLNKEASLYRNETSTDIINFTTNIPLAQFLLELAEDEGTDVALTPADEAAGIVAKIENSYYEVQVVSDGTNGKGDIIGHFLFVAKADWDATAPTPESTLTVYSGLIKFNIDINQRDASPEDWIEGGNKDENLKP